MYLIFVLIVFTIGFALAIKEGVYLYSLFDFINIYDYDNSSLLHFYPLNNDYNDPFYRSNDNNGWEMEIYMRNVHGEIYKINMYDFSYDIVDESEIE